MAKVSFFAMAPLPCAAEEGPRRLWWVSVATLTGAAAADVHSSWGKQELNPVLRSGDGRFGWRGLVVKSGATGAALLVQWLVLRRHPGTSRTAAAGNLAVSSALAGVALRNHRFPRLSPGTPPPHAVPLR